MVSFREKPEIEIAKGFMESGRFLWNSGMFLWKACDLFEEMRKCCIEVIGPLENIDPMNEDELKEAYEKTERISIDYALMERSDSVRVIPTNIEWSDLGSWESIMEIEGRSCEGPNISLPGSNNIMIRSTSGRHIAVVGLSNVIIVDTKEGLLVLDKGSSQKVRESSRHFN